MLTPEEGVAVVNAVTGDAGGAAHPLRELIESVIRTDLRGEALYENRPEGGALVTITFPRQ